MALDGTKIRANASRHSALSYEHAGKIEEQLKAEVADLLAKAEAADQSEVPDGMSIPEELERRSIGRRMRIAGAPAARAARWRAWRSASVMALSPMGWRDMGCTPNRYATK